MLPPLTLWGAGVCVERLGHARYRIVQSLNALEPLGVQRGMAGSAPEPHLMLNGQLSEETLKEHVQVLMQSDIGFMEGVLGCLGREE